MELEQITNDILSAIVAIDASREPFRNYLPGVGPYSEPQLVKLIAARLNSQVDYNGMARTQRTPDLMINETWAVEFKITRPFGDNGNEAENWSVNLLHPYPGNVSTIGDCLKLLALARPARKAIVVIGYEHTPAIIDLTPLINSFEVIARDVVGIRLTNRFELKREGLIHPIHQAVRLFTWEVLNSPS